MALGTVETGINLLLNYRFLFQMVLQSLMYSLKFGSLSCAKLTKACSHESLGSDILTFDCFSPISVQYLDTACWFFSRSDYHVTIKCASVLYYSWYF